jgi:hypothetical protein
MFPPRADRALRACQYAVGDRVQRDRNGIALEVTGVRVIGQDGKDERVQINHQPHWIAAEGVRPTVQTRSIA